MIRSISPLLFLLLLSSHAYSQALDPEWTTYMGGPAEDWGKAVAVGADGSIALCGRTGSGTAIAFGGSQTVHGGGEQDAYLAVFDEEGLLQWATYFGGPGEDHGHAVAIDGMGRILIVGGTDSETGIASGGQQNSYGGGFSDGFLACFDTDGSVLWSTYFGGSDLDVATGVAVNAGNEIFITGYTRSTDGIALSDAWQQDLSGGYDGFFAKYSPAGALIWSSYYGGTNDEFFEGVAVGDDGSFFLCGTTESISGMVFNGHQVGLGGNRDGFLAKFNSIGVRVWSTYYGGPGNDYGYGCGVDADGNSYLVGSTTSATNIGADGHLNTLAGGFDGYLVKFNSNGVRQWGTYYGGPNYDESRGVAIGPDGTITLIGQSGSPTGIATPDGFQPESAGGSEGFIARFDQAGVRQWASYVGGPAGDGLFGISSHSSGWLAVSGNTMSDSGLATDGAHQDVYGGSGDGFLMKLGVDITTGMMSAKERPMELFYDPIAQEVLLSEMSRAKIIVHDAQGRVLIQRNNTNSVPMAALPMGVYLVTATVEGDPPVIQRFVKY